MTGAPLVAVSAIRTGTEGRADIKLSNTKRNCSKALIVRQQGVRKTCLGSIKNTFVLLELV